MKKLLTIIALFVAFTCFAQENLMIGSQPCGPHGSSAEGSMEYRQNVFKNRFDFPSQNDIDKSITMEKILSGGLDWDRFKQNKAGEIIGYVYEVKPGGSESCNCKSTDKAFFDTHIEITPNSTRTDPSKRVIVEVTPRIRTIMLQKGIDWSTEQLKSTIKGRMVKIQGWMFYDSSHEFQSFSTNPGNASGRNWRATCWELHPITNIEILEESPPLASLNTETETNPPIIQVNQTPPGNNLNNNVNNNSNKNMENTPLNILVIIILGSILGMVGQGMRVVVGLKKLSDDNASKPADQKTAFSNQQLLTSLLIAFAIGAIAGVLASLGNLNLQTLDKSTLMAFIAAGYAGTDFIEGFMNKNPIK